MCVTLTYVLRSHAWLEGTVAELPRTVPVGAGNLQLSQEWKFEETKSLFHCWSLVLISPLLITWLAAQYLLLYHHLLLYIIYFYYLFALAEADPERCPDFFSARGPSARADWIMCRKTNWSCRPAVLGWTTGSPDAFTARWNSQSESNYFTQAR